MHKMNVLDNKPLLHAIGMKFNDGVHCKVTGASDKGFQCNNVTYAYPLFKIHKMEPK